MRLWLVEHVGTLQTLLLGLLAVASDRAEQDIDHVMPGKLFGGLSGVHTRTFARCTMLARSGTASGSALALIAALGLLERKRAPQPILRDVRWGMQASAA